MGNGFYSVTLIILTNSSFLILRMAKIKQYDLLFLILSTYQTYQTFLAIIKCTWFEVQYPEKQNNLKEKIKLSVIKTSIQTLIKKSLGSFLLTILGILNSDSIPPRPTAFYLHIALAALSLYFVAKWILFLLFSSFSSMSNIIEKPETSSLFIIDPRWSFSWIGLIVLKNIFYF